MSYKLCPFGEFLKPAQCFLQGSTLPTGGAGENRTPDTVIKSHMPYHLATTPHGRGEGIRTPNPQGRRILSPLHIPILPLPHICKVGVNSRYFSEGAIARPQPYNHIVSQTF